MDPIQSTISSFHKVLSSFKFQKPMTFPEEFAQARYLKKFQVPNDANKELLVQQCWDQWISFDASLPNSILRPAAEFYKARLAIHKIAPCNFKNFALPQGSEFTPTRGNNSVEARLCKSDWTCTYDNFERFARIVYDTKGLKRAFRRRYNNWFVKQNFDLTLTQADKFLFKKYKSTGVKNPAYEAYLFKLSKVVHFHQGSRFSTVPKNNERDRPINVECFGNTVVQRSIGIHIRNELKKLFSIDLDTLAETHRELIASNEYATIDLSNASDSVSLALCEFLLPTHLMKAITASRSDFILGHDGQYHKIRKVSSMGNGFTFELMTLILTAVARTMDPTASVFGDDIIIKKEHAVRMIQLIESVGFVVNKEKSFIDGPFRESCGGNYHDDFGYIESYDFKWPSNIHDCIVFFNKTRRLGNKYPSFEQLVRSLHRTIPKVLQGVTERDFFQKEVPRNYAATNSLYAQDAFFSGYFRSYNCRNVVDLNNPKIQSYLRQYQYEASDILIFNGFKYVGKLRTPTLKHLTSRDWAKYEMYLFASRKAPDEVVGAGGWVMVKYISVAGSTDRWNPSAYDLIIT